MESDFNRAKHVNPAPPLNARKAPAAEKEEPKHYGSVYDEIAERKKREKQQKEDDVNLHFGKKALKEEQPNSTDDDVKVYRPDKSDKPDKDDTKVYNAKEKSGGYTDIYIDEERKEENEEENLDVLPLPEPKKKIGLWAVLIAALSVLCLIAAGAYGIVNGYVDGIISML